MTDFSTLISEFVAEALERRNAAIEELAAQATTSGIKFATRIQPYKISVEVWIDPMMPVGFALDEDTGTTYRIRTPASPEPTSGSAPSTDAG